MISLRITVVVALLAFFTYVLPCGTEIFAQESSPSASKDSINSAGAVEIGESIIGPTHPLYFLKTAREYLEIKFFTPSTDLSKVVRELEFAQRRLREAKYLIKNKRQDLIVPIMEQYKNYLMRADRIAPDRQNIQSEIAQAKARHLDVLMRLYDEAGEPDAKRAIRVAIVEIEEYNRNILEEMTDVVAKDQLKEKIVKRQEIACRFLSREASSSALNDTERAYFSSKAKECQ